MDGKDGGIAAAPITGKSGILPLNIKAWQACPLGFPFLFVDFAVSRR
jgi:hypothetical protein